MNRLHWHYEIDEPFGLTLRPFIHGEDLLEGVEHDIGMDPDELLPPLSSVLLPTTVGGDAIVGRCGCGEVGCGSFALAVRRDGGDVVWGPSSNRLHDTLTRTYRFNLREYLDAIDRAVAEPPPDEGQGRRVKRMVRAALGRTSRSTGQT